MSSIPEVESLVNNYVDCWKKHRPQYTNLYEDNDFGCEHLQVFRSGFQIQAFSHDDLCHLSALLTRSLRGQINRDHKEFWSWCSFLTLAFRSQVELFKDGDWVEAFRSLVHLLLVPLNVDVYNERSRNISPDLEEVALEKHLIAGPLAFAVLEGILRRKNSHYVNNDGIVHTPFTVVQPTGKRHSQAKGLLNRINISLRLFEQVVTENRGRPCSALKLMSDEIAGLYPGSIDAYDLVDLWRNDLVHGNQYWQNRVPIILNIICLLIIDDVEPDLYRDNSKEVRQLHDWLRTTRPDLSAFDN